MRDMVSSKPSKQRLNQRVAPAHMKRNQISAPLSETLREKHGRRSVSLRRGDRVKIVRGDYAGVEGKIEDVETKTARIYVEGVTREAVAGTTKRVPIHSSKVMVTALNLDDKRRDEKLRRITVGGNES